MTQLTNDFFARSLSPDTGRLILRLTIGGLMLPHGINKVVNGIGWMAGPLGGVGLPAWFGYGVYLAEVVAPILLILGIWSRPAALVIVFDMMMAIFLVFRGRIFALKEMGGGLGIELELLFLFGALAIFFFGSGRFGLSRGVGRFD